MIEIAQVNIKGAFKCFGNQSYVCISIIEYTVGIQGINQFGQCRFTSCPIERRVIKRFFLIAIELVFKVNLYQIIGDYFGDFIIPKNKPN